MVRRIFVEKKTNANVEAKEMLSDLRENLGLTNLKDLKILNRYDVEGISEEVFEKAKNTIFSEPQVDICYEEEYKANQGEIIFGVEFLPGQFDQRANSLSECLQIITEGEKLLTRTAKIYVLNGELSKDDVERVKKYLINPVDSRECTLEKYETLKAESEEPEDVKVVEGFIKEDENELNEFYKKYGFAMDIEDLKFCQRYFRDEEKRDPTVTEMKMIDTYWSDHCRHTTFMTKLETIDIKWDLLEKVFEDYKKSREYVYENKKADKAPRRSLSVRRTAFS